MLKGAFIVPHPPIIIKEVGKGEEKKVKDTLVSLEQVAKRIAAIGPDTLIITTPHSIMYSDYFHISPGKDAKGSFSRFGESKLKFQVNYDTDFVRALVKNAEQFELAAGTMGEKEAALDHGTMVPLYFINQYFKDYRIIRIGLSGLPLTDHYKLGKCIAKTANDIKRKIVFIASGDLSHVLSEEGPYGYAPEGAEFDQEVVKAIVEGNFLRFFEMSPDLCEAAAECGLRSFVIMAGALSGKSITSKLLSYEGPFGVGYAVGEFDIIGEDPERNFDEVFEAKQRAILEEKKAREDAYVTLARRSLESYVKNGEPIVLPEELPEEMLREKAGVFVSLKLYGQLRGCIGTIMATKENIATEIITNAISAGLEDPRFPPVTIAELSKIEYSVDVLGKPEPISRIEELDVKRFGVIVSTKRKRGLLLPNLEGIDTPEKQVSIAKQKAGIHQNEEFNMERFEVVRHK